MSDPEMEDATIEELQPLEEYSDSSSYLGSEEEEEGVDIEDEEKDASESENNDRIRVATNYYLEGSYTLADLTAALEGFKETPEKGSVLDDTVPGCSKNLPEVVKPARPVPKKVAERAKPAQTQGKVGFGFDTSMLPPESTWEQRPKYTADFYSTGEQVSSFTLRRRRKMSPTVQGMMGEAHLRYVRGELKSAIGICQEIIKEQPTITDPYALLSLIYWDLNENDRALRFGMIGAFLDPKHCKEWPRLAEWSLGQGNVQQAISCYTHSLSVNPGVPELYYRRCELMKLANDTAGAIKGYHRLIHALPKDGKACVQAYRKIAQLHYAEKDKEKAYQVLCLAFRDYSEYITNIEVNLILELMKSFKKYVEAIQLLQKHTKVEFKPPLEKSDFATRPGLSKALFKRTSVATPPQFPAELTVKLITSLIHLEAYDLAKSLVPQVLAKPIDKFGDLYLEVAEAYMAKGRWASSVELTSLIVKSPNMKEASLCFLRHAETLYSLGKLEESANAYETVIKLVPNHNVAKLNYALILQKLGRSEDALQTLDQDEEEKTIDHHLIAEKCKIYIRQKRPHELLKTTLFLLSRHCHTFRSKEDTLGVSTTTHSDKRYDSVQVNRVKRDEHPYDKRPTFLEKTDITDAEWQIYLHACQVCLDMERYDLLERFTYTAWSSENFGQNPKMEKACGYHAYLASILNLDQELLAPHVKFQSLNVQD
ncbi:unnamed protein product [Allacma fusca]|uniref:General transcription factor 3C polypeptide 3 n=1 Tax=Allacma fusca TaxID=39272 RepID=A0A8J2NQM0_9HEXA|nr:unnamed protein product [Allacma fusca]